MLRGCLSRPASGLEDTADSRGRGLDIKFVKQKVLHLIKIYGRFAIKELKQSLDNNVSKYLTLCQGLIPASSTLVEYLVYLA